MSGQDKWLGSKTLVVTKLGNPPGTSKSATATTNDRGVSAAARANQMAMSRRLDVRAHDMRTTLVRRTSINRSYKRSKKKKKKKLRTPSAREEELALLEPLEFMSKRPRFGMCGTVQFYDFAGPGAAAARLFHLSESDLRKIKKCFDSIDTDESGTITQGEFFTMLELKDTPFTRQLCQRVVFEIADSDESNTLSFDEFVLGVCVVCTLTRDQLLYFVFRCFDVDNSGQLNHGEFLTLSEAVNAAGGGFFDGNFSQLLEKFDSNNDGNVDFDEFLMIDTYFPMAFFPVFRMQGELRNKTLKWDKWMTKVTEYNKEERRKIANRYSRQEAVPPRAFIDRMASLGAMKQVVERGGIKALKMLDGDNDSRSSRNRSRSEATSESSTEDGKSARESGRDRVVNFQDDGSTVASGGGGDGGSLSGDDSAGDGVSNGADAGGGGGGGEAGSQATASDVPSLGPGRGEEGSMTSSQQGERHQDSNAVTPRIKANQVAPELQGNEAGQNEKKKKKRGFFR